MSTTVDRAVFSLRMVYGSTPRNGYLKISKNSALFIPMTIISSPLKEQKHCHRKHFLASKYPQNAFTAGALCPGPHWEKSQRSPDPAELGEGRKRREGQRRGEGRGGKGKGRR